jgi:MFS family permease
MLQNLKHHYVKPLRSFNRAARLFLLMIIIDGVIFSGWQLFFNFYILQSGFSREFLGLVNSMPSAAGLIFGIPLGRLSDRIGRRLSIMVGLGMSSVFMLAQITIRQPSLIVAAAFVYGAASMLFIVSQAPLMTRLSDRDNRTMLFSLSFGLQTISGAVGALFAGQLPGFFGAVLKVSAHSASAYQAVLILSIVLGTTALVPIWLMKEPRESSLAPAAAGFDRSGASIPGRAKLPAGLIATTAKMTGPQVLIGFGAAILIPYINVFFKDGFAISDSVLGLLFSLSSLLIGIGSLLAPRLATLLGSKIRAVVATQSASLMFLLLIGFSPILWLSSTAYLLRTTLMNMSAPLYSAFCMERTPEQHQGFVNSVLNLAWSLGWAVGPFVSGLVQERYGFQPLFVTTAILYGLASWLIWKFFRHSEGAETARQVIVHGPEFVE